MPLEDVGVNLWKTDEVSYLQTDSYSTGSNRWCCDNFGGGASNCHRQYGRTAQEANPLCSSGSVWRVIADSFSSFSCLR